MGWGGGRALSLSLTRFLLATVRIPRISFSLSTASFPRNRGTRQAAPSSTPYNTFSPSLPLPPLLSPLLSPLSFLSSPLPLWRTRCLR